MAILDDLMAKLRNKAAQNDTALIEEKLLYPATGTEESFGVADSINPRFAAIAENPLRASPDELADFQNARDSALVEHRKAQEWRSPRPTQKAVNLDPVSLGVYKLVQMLTKPSVADVAAGGDVLGIGGTAADVARAVDSTAYDKAVGRALGSME